jgi:hypothetical protein
MKVVLPENLDLSVLTSRYKPNFCFKLDRCKYILNLLAERPAYDRRLRESTDDNPYVPLSAAIMVHQVRDYQHYLRYLVETGVLECDGRYEVGRKCKGYRYSETYRTKPTTDQITNLRLIASNQKWVSRVNQPALESYPVLLPWLDGLELDEQAALARIELDYEKSLSSTHTQAKNRAYVRYMARLGMINRFAHNPAICRIDDKAYRLHTKLTNFWSELRPCLTYKGHPLIAVDLSCSQPYLATVLLQDFFYDGNEANGRITISQLPSAIQGRLHTKPTILTAYQSNLIEAELVGQHPPYSPFHPPSPNPASQPIPHPSLMLAFSMSKQAFEQEFHLFRTSVEEGRLYDKLGEYIQVKLGKTITNRQQLKDIMFSIFFSDNNATENFIIRACTIFSATFPLIYNIFRELKAESNSDLAILLQAIEAELFLNRIAKRISREKPQLPIFTLHDSIVTLDGYEAYVEEVMRDELTKAIGIIPHFKREEWGTQLSETVIPVQQPSGIDAN